MPVQARLRAPQILVEIVHLTDGVRNHLLVSVCDAVPGHKRRTHIEVIRPERTLLGPVADQRSVRKALLPVADVLRSPLDKILIQGLPRIIVEVDERPVLRTDEIQFIVAAEGVEYVPVHHVAGLRVYLIIIGERIFDLFQGIADIGLISGDLGELYQR